MESRHIHQIQIATLDNIQNRRPLNKPKHLNNKNNVAFQFFFNTAHKIGFSPYKYDAKVGRLQYVHSAIHKCVYIGNFVLILAYELLLIYRYFQTLGRKGATMKDKLTGLFFPLIYTALNLNHYISWKNWGVLHFLFNQSADTALGIRDAVVLHERNLKHSAHNKIDIRLARKIKIFTNTALFMVMFTGVLRAGKVMTTPESPELLSSLLTDQSVGKKLSITKKLIFTVLQFNITFFHIYVYTFHFINCVTYGLYMSVSLQELCITKNSQCTTIMDTNELHMRCESYHHIGVLHSFFTEIYNLWPLLGDVCLVFVVIFYLFIAVVYQSIRNLIGAVTMLLGILLLFGMFGEVHESSKEMLSSWRAISDPWFRRYCISVRLIKISVAGFFYVDKRLILTIVSIVINTLSSLLVAYRKQ